MCLAFVKTRYLEDLNIVNIWWPHFKRAAVFVLTNTTNVYVDDTLNVPDILSEVCNIVHVVFWT